MLSVRVASRHKPGRCLLSIWTTSITPVDSRSLSNSTPGVDRSVVAKNPRCDLPKRVSQSQKAGRPACAVHDVVIDEAGDMRHVVASPGRRRLPSGRECKLIVAGNPTRVDGLIYSAAATHRHDWASRSSPASRTIRSGPQVSGSNGHASRWLGLRA